VKVVFFQVLLNTTGDNIIESFDPKNLGVFSFIMTFLVVTIVVSQTQTLLSLLVEATLSITQVVRLSGSASVVITVLPFLSVV
jgi:hypothetical protein